MSLLALALAWFLRTATGLTDAQRGALRGFAVVALGLAFFVLIPALSDLLPTELIIRAVGAPEGGGVGSRELLIVSALSAAAVAVLALIGQALGDGPSRARTLARAALFGAAARLAADGVGIGLAIVEDSAAGADALPRVGVWVVAAALLATLALAFSWAMAARFGTTRSRALYAPGGLVVAVAILAVVPEGSWTLDNDAFNRVLTVFDQVGYLLLVVARVLSALLIVTLFPLVAEAERRWLGLALFATFVIGPGQVVLLVIPLGALIAWLAMDAIGMAAAPTQPLTPAAPGAPTPDADSAARAALAQGPYTAEIANAWFGARLGLLVGLALTAAAVSPTTFAADPYPWQGFVVRVVATLARWTVFGAFVGMYFRWLVGTTGLAKGARVGAIAALAVLPTFIAAIVAQADLVGAFIFVLEWIPIAVLLGVAFDLRSLQIAEKLSLGRAADRLVRLLGLQAATATALTLLGALGAAVVAQITDRLAPALAGLLAPLIAPLSR